MKLVTVSQAQGRVPITVFQLQDRLNMGNTAELEQAAKEAYAAGGRNMIIDLSKAPSLTSAGIRTIMIIYKMLSEPGQETKHLKLVSPTPYVRDVLDISGLLTYIEVYETLAEAVAYF
jgi:stage II sporulation protein AA (anti-sigma F factor antagonist)